MRRDKREKEGEGRCDGEGVAGENGRMREMEVDSESPVVFLEQMGDRPLVCVCIYIIYICI